MPRTNAVHPRSATGSARSGSRRPLPRSPRIALIATPVALLALGVGALLLEWESGAPSIISEDASSPAGANGPRESSATASGDASTGTGQPPREEQSAASVSGDDPMAATTRRGDDVIARMNARIAENPPQGQAQAGHDAEFAEDVSELRDEIDRLRNEVDSGRQ